MHAESSGPVDSSSQRRSPASRHCSTSSSTSTDFNNPDELSRIETIVVTGKLIARPGGPFTAAFLHLPRQLAVEVTRAGFESVEIVGVEGPGFVVTDLERRRADPHRREALMIAARLTEHDPEMLAATSHLMAIGHTPQAAPGPPPSCPTHT